MKGDRLRVRRRKGSVDGVVLERSRSVDDSMISANVPGQKQVGDELIGATVNGTGTLIMEA